MTAQLYTARTPRFNHVAMSLPADMLDAGNRALITDFWSTVFGFEEIPQMTEDRRRLVLSACHWEQFVFLVAEDEPMRCPRLDHFGISVGSLDDLRAAYERAADFAARDSRVDLIEASVEDHEVVRIHAFYAGYLLPMMMEVQYWEYAS